MSYTGKLLLYAIGLECFLCVANLQEKSKDCMACYIDQIEIGLVRFIINLEGVIFYQCKLLKIEIFCNYHNNLKICYNRLGSYGMHVLLFLKKICKYLYRLYTGVPSANY